MKVLILGFTSIPQLNKVINELIEESQCFLFSIVCGGVGSKGPKSVAEEWAELNGAPLYYIVKDTPEKLMYSLVQECDFLVCALTATSPQWHKNIVMKFKSEGKHGKVVQL